MEIRLNSKEDEVKNLNKKMVLFETYKHKYDIKEKETNILL